MNSHHAGSDASNAAPGPIVLVLRSPEQASRIADPAIRRLVETRFIQVCAGEPYDSEQHGYMLVVEPGDTLQTIERESGVPVLTDLFGEAHFGDPEFTPAAEVIEDRGTVYELVFVFSDDGYGVEIFVPKAAGVDPELLAMCAVRGAARDVAPQ